MRVWLIDEFGHGGIGRYAVDVANLIGDEVVATTVVTSDLGPVQGLRQASEIWFPRGSGSRVGKILAGLTGLVRIVARVRRSDVAWVPLGIRPGFELTIMLALKLVRAESVVTVHNRAPHGRVNDSYAVILAARLARAVVVHTESLETWAQSKRLAAVRLPFPTPRLHADLSSEPVTRQTLLIPDNVLLVTLLGYLYSYKGPDVLVSALASALTIQPNLPVHLLLAGRLPEGETLTDLICLNGLEGHVTLRSGWLEESELAGLMRLTDVAALPYRRVDNSGIGAVARHYRKPAIASDLPALRELFGSGAVYAQPGDVPDFTRRLLELPKIFPNLVAGGEETSETTRASYAAFVESLRLTPRSRRRRVNGIAFWGNWRC